MCWTTSFLFECQHLRVLDLEKALCELHWIAEHTIMRHHTWCSPKWKWYWMLSKKIVNVCQKSKSAVWQGYRVKVFHQFSKAHHESGFSEDIYCMYICCSRCSSSASCTYLGISLGCTLWKGMPVVSGNGRQKGWWGTKSGVLNTGVIKSWWSWDAQEIVGYPGKHIEAV